MFVDICTTCGKQPAVKDGLCIGCRGFDATATPAAAAPQGERMSEEMLNVEEARFLSRDPAWSEERKRDAFKKVLAEARRARQSEHDLTVLGIKRENQLIDLRRSEAALRSALEEIAKNGSPTWAQERAKRALSALKQRDSGGHHD